MLLGKIKYLYLYDTINMSEIIDFKWCEKNGFERPGMNVASDTSYCLLTEDKKWYQVVYTESTMGHKKLSVMNHKTKKDVTIEMPKFDFSKEGEDIKNNFTTNDLKIMYQLVDMEYPIKENTEDNE